MLLAIDIGNTNITLGVWNGRHWEQKWRLHTNHAKTADEYGVILMSLLRKNALLSKIKQGIMTSVVPVLTQTFTELCTTYIGVDILNVTSNLDLGITIQTDVPAAVGADRLVNAVAANTLYPGPSIVIDMGTATKFDVVSAKQEFLGGVITPGLGLAADALVSRAAKLTSVSLEAPPQAIGRNTVEAMQSGLVFGYVALIEGMLARLKNEHPDNKQPITILGTGGLINLITPHTTMIDHVDPWLTLTGLRLIEEKLNADSKCVTV